MAESLRSDGRAVEVTLLGTVTKGDAVHADGFFGIAMADGVSGDIVALEIAQREHEVVVPGGVTAAKGDVIYISTAGVITNLNTDKPFMKVTQAKDANDVVWGILLPQA